MTPAHVPATTPGSGWTEPRITQRPVPGILDVITVVSNPVRYDSRNTLYRNFERHMHASGVRLTTVECAFGDRPFEVTEPGNDRHIQIRTNNELWIKESMIRVGISRLPADAQYIGWLDSDIQMLNPNWVQETIQALQHYDIVQCFSESSDLGPDGMILNTFRSFAWSHINGVPRQPGQGYYGGTPQSPKSNIAYFHHPGFAWAARKDALNTMGGLFDVAVVGEADWIMARGLLGEAEATLYPGVSPGYRKAVMDYQGKALKLRKNLGYVPCTLVHFFHGLKEKRAYWDRCKILTETQFDPTTDISRDHQGLWQLVDDGTDRYILLRDSLRKYFRSRAEDATTA